MKLIKEGIIRYTGDIKVFVKLLYNNNCKIKNLEEWGKRLISFRY